MIGHSLSIGCVRRNKQTTMHLNDNEPMISVSTSTTSMTLSTLTCDGRQTAGNSCVVCRVINSDGCNKYSNAARYPLQRRQWRYDDCAISVSRLQLSQHGPFLHLFCNSFHRHHVYLYVNCCPFDGFMGLCFEKSPRLPKNPQESPRIPKNPQESRRK